MDERKWAEILSLLLKYAGEIFDSLEGFKNGRLIVEADGEKNRLKITVKKAATQALTLNFELVPLEEEPITEKEEPKLEIPPETKTSEPKPETTVEQAESISEEVTEGPSDEEKETKSEPEAFDLYF